MITQTKQIIKIQPQALKNNKLKKFKIKMVQLLLLHSLPYLVKEEASIYHKKEIKFNLLKLASKKNGKKKGWMLKMIRAIQQNEVGARRLKRRKKKKMMKKTVILSLKRK